MANEDLTRAAAPGPSPVARAKMLVTHAAELKVVLPFGFPALIGSGASLAACYVSSFVNSVLGIPNLGLNPHVQAALMAAFALFAAYALWQDRKHHHNDVPAALGAIAVAALIITLYVRYS